jgi:hypothetical protein
MCKCTATTALTKRPLALIPRVLRAEDDDSKRAPACLPIHHNPCLASPALGARALHSPRACPQAHPQHNALLPATVQPTVYALMNVRSHPLRPTSVKPYPSCPPSLQHCNPPHNNDLHEGSLVHLSHVLRARDDHRPLSNWWAAWYSRLPDSHTSLA